MNASTARKERKDNSNKRQANEITDAVKKRLGLTTLPNTAPPGTKNPGKWASPTSTLALNLKGKDKGMYGIEASKFTNDEMIKRNLAKEGNYFKKVGGEFIRLSKAEGRKLYATGDPNISRSAFHTSNSMKIKYGSKWTHGGNEVMGSGDPSGAMSSIPISSKMLESQNKAQAIIGLAVGALAPAPFNLIGKATAGKAAMDLKQPGAAYEDYTKKFDATQQGKKFTSQRNVLGIMNLGLTKGKKTLKDKLGI
tara:strand:- start:5360 stop:6115 length:756 start_codon:yes stop_codon:yes gene_type:complete